MSITTLIREKVKISDLTNSYNKYIDCPCCKKINKASVINNEYVYCFSASCGFKANVIQLNSFINSGDTETLSIKASIKNLIERFHIDCPQNTVDKKKHDFYREVAAIYFDSMTPRELEYLYGRGISDYTIKQLNIGYADGTSLRSNLSRTSLVTYGFLGDSNKEFFRDRLMFNLPNTRGNIETFVGRYLGNIPEAPRYKNLATNIHTMILEQYVPIYNASDTLYIAEGYMDTISLHQMGCQALGILGVNGLVNYMDLISKFKDVVFCFDSDLDDHGNYKSWKVILPQIINIIMMCPDITPWVYLPVNKDINESMRTDGLSIADIQRDRVSLCQFVIDQWIKDMSKHVYIIKLIEVLKDTQARNFMWKSVGKSSYNYAAKILDY